MKFSKVFGAQNSSYSLKQEKILASKQLDIHSSSYSLVL